MWVAKFVGTGYTGAKTSRGKNKLKDYKRFVSWTAIFVAGFLTGVLFSAWKMDSQSGPASAPPPAAMTEQGKQTEIRNRIAGIEKMLEVNPGNLEALIQLGNDYFDTGNFEKAVGAYRKALAIDPRNTDVIVDMAIGYRRLGQPQEAAGHLKSALEIDANQAVALFNLGLIQRDDLKDYPAALDAWERFLKIAADSPHAVMVGPWVKKLREQTGVATPASQAPGDKQ